jgi:hypothetical protein
MNEPAVTSGRRIRPARHSDLKSVFLSDVHHTLDSAAKIDTLPA